MAHDNFYAQHPHATKLGLKPVVAGAAEHPGYDMEDVEKALGDKFPRFQEFLSGKSVFVCAHRTVPHEVKDENGKTITVQGEAHCAYAKDVEEFLNAQS